MNARKTHIVVMTLAVLMFSGCLNNPESRSTGNTVTDIADNSRGVTDVTVDNSDEITDVTVDNSGKVVVYFFWGDGCPHCAHQKPFMEELEQRYPSLEVKMFETWNNRENAELFKEMANAYGVRASGVPTTFIGDKHWIGYAEYMGEEMDAKIQSCIATGCINPGDKLN